MDESVLKEVVRAVVSQLLKGEGGIIKDTEPKSGIASVKKISAIKQDPFPFDLGPAGKGVFLKDLFSLDESPRLGIGVMEMKETSFPWTLRYDEVDYILEGTLDIKTNGKIISGSAGDIIYIPKDSPIEFCAPDHVKFFYVTYPADWSNQ
ncbi:MAG: cupin domain-containing protein [Synergistaceae bacterium]|jgi:ethanolamine utilization protein EutQ|nr:cupin domain-containing protein [Synergistaceae bacterium]